MIARPDVSPPQLLVSGTLVGLGIGAMHYSGMAAMQTSLLMLYEPVEFALSIALAIALATLSLWIRFGLRRTALNRVPRFLISGTVMGLAIAGMHYTGMAAARFPEGSICGAAVGDGLQSEWLAMLVVMLTVAI
ncbi:MHYT domain-containing protein, partial [Klebsiella pneumoniae]